jgi:hypothetical protein
MVDLSLSIGVPPSSPATVLRHRVQKKAGVEEHPEVFDHAGLLI